ncbi:MAG: hypothetical protein ACPGSC_13070, partial [Granulosicoccaceae bacterium]
AVRQLENSLHYCEDWASEMSCECLGEIYSKGLGVKQDLDKAEEYFLRAGFNGDRDYLHKLAVKQLNDKHKN